MAEPADFSNFLLVQSAESAESGKFLSRCLVLSLNIFSLFGNFLRTNLILH
jgi:hypothetical protein